MTNWDTGWNWDCTRSQAMYSNSYYSGQAPYPTTKSKGQPSRLSDASLEPSNMSGGSPATGNPLNYTNYQTNLKWGSPNTGTTGKWNNSNIIKPDAFEASANYEGEKFSGSYLIRYELE